MSGCTVQRLEAPGLTFLKVSGTVDETFSANQLSQQIRADTILHLGKVGRFSSFGVREWVHLMKDLRGRVKHCILVECSPAVVNQLNMVVDFAAGAHVKSVQLPYACQSCELDKMVTVDVDAQRAELLAGQLPQVPCPQCHNPMVFDDLPNSYLAFLRDSLAPDATSPMAKFIASFEQNAPKFADGDAISPSPVAPLPPLAPAIDPTVPPPMPVSPGGSSGAMKWVAITAVALLVLGGGYVAMNRNPPQVRPPPPDPNVVVDHTPPPPPAKPEKRNMTVEEGLEVQNMNNQERFAEAEVFITKLEPLLLEESTKKARELIQSAKSVAFEKHMSVFQTAMRRGEVQSAEDELEAAVSIGGESDRVLFSRITSKRRAGNCPAVIAAADAIAERYPGSSYAKPAADARKACMAPPPIGPVELKKAIAVLQNDIDRCLEAPRPADQTGNSIDLAWTVNPTGAVTQASCTTPSMAKSALCQCLTEQVRRLRFSEKPGVQARRGAYTFTANIPG